MVVMDESAYGSRRPNWFDRRVMALTEKLPTSRLGGRLAVLLRRATTMRVGTRAMDVETFGVKLRLYTLGNGCEKTALFTPQMFKPVSRRVIAQEVAAARAQGRRFVFVDVGANVGLLSFVACRLAEGAARALAIEPQPGIAERLAFNIALNPGFDVRPLRVAIAERDGDNDFFIDARDLGGSRFGGRGIGSESLRLRARRLAPVLAEEGFEAADVLKLTIEGTEDLVLEAFLRETAKAALPRVVVVADNRALWTRDLFAELAVHGYLLAESAPQELVFRRD